MTTQPKTVKEILTLSEHYLASQQIENPRLISEMLLSRLLKRPRLELSLDYAKTLPESHLQAMRRGIKRVGDGEPVQYVIGEAGFMNHVFKVDRRALIPRPETEVLVNLVLDCDAIWQHEKPAIADVGTGSGCIILSLAAARPHGRYLALDISEEALALARENATRMNLSDKVIFTHQPLSDIIEPETLHAMTANLPYIPSADIETLPSNVREHEPRLALDGGPNGLDIITHVVEDAAIVLRNEGMLFLEIGEQQGQAVAQSLQTAGFDSVTVHPDLNGRDRVVSGRLAI